MKYLPFFAILLVIACSRSDDDNAITRSNTPDTTKYGVFTILVDTAWSAADTTICFK